MKKELFDELLESIHEAGAIARGELEPASITTFPAVEMRAIRQNFGATQLEFSRMIGVSLATLRNWEQGRRMPQGPARMLLLVVAKHPQVVRRVIAEYRAAAVTESFSGSTTLPARVAERGEHGQQVAAASREKSTKRPPRSGSARARRPARIVV